MLHPFYYLSPPFSFSITNESAEFNFVFINKFRFEAPPFYNERVLPCENIEIDKESEKKERKWKFIRNTYIVPVSTGEIIILSLLLFPTLANHDNALGKAIVTPSISMSSPLFRTSETQTRAIAPENG